MPVRPALRLATLGLALAATVAHAEPTPPAQSAMDAPLFYEILAGEVLAREGVALEAVQALLAAAERVRDPALYQRAIEVAAQAHRGDLARAVAQAWQRTLPHDVDADRTLLQLAVALREPQAVAAPLARLIEGLPLPERAGVIASVPRFLAGLTDKPAAYAAARAALEPQAATTGLAVPVEVSLGRLALAAGDTAEAARRAQRAAAADPDAPGPVLLTLELLEATPALQPLVDAYLARPNALAPVRLAYARVLADQNLLAPAAAQAQRAAETDPNLGTAWLTLAAYRVELREPAATLAALARWRALPPEGDAAALAQARRFADLLAAQAAFHQGDMTATAQWLTDIPPEEATLSVLLLRARLLAREGRLTDARALLQVGTSVDQPTPLARARAEVQLLTDERQWRTALQVLDEARARFPDSQDLVLEWARAAEQLGRHEEAERELRTLLAKSPDDAHLRNALGYALADRGVRLTEAQDLLRSAHLSRPSNPYITDSVGWLAYRQGRPADALPLLQASFDAHPHAEVAAHLGEVLWVLGRQDEARAILRDGLARDAGNAVLTETLRRLGIGL